MYLAIHQHRIEDLAAIVDGDVAADSDGAGLAIDFGNYDVGAERENEVGRLPEVCRD